MIYMYNYKQVGAITVITVPLQVKAGPAFENSTPFDEWETPAFSTTFLYFKHDC